MSRLKRGYASAQPPAAPVATQRDPAPPPTPAAKRKVIFICIGNSCRSQMAEGFARKYGSDVMEVFSAGLSPIDIVQPLTVKVMKDRGIDISAQYTKDLLEAPGAPWDIAVNLSGLQLPAGMPGTILEWPVADPYTLPESAYIQSADHIESLVQRLILSLRMQRA